MSLVVFFQVEDGIRDIGVTGVQTCALPIWLRTIGDFAGVPSDELVARLGQPALRWQQWARGAALRPLVPTLPTERSEERRVGKGVDLGGRRIIKKKRSSV